LGLTITDNGADYAFIKLGLTITDNSTGYAFIKLGLTITDNSAGYAFIKRIRAGSLMSRVPLVAVGDVLEALDGRSLVGARHFEVARLLQELPRGQRFRLRLTEPRRAWETPKISLGDPKNDPGDPKIPPGTLRDPKNPPKIADPPQPSAFEERAVAKVDDLLESYMGIRDSELVQNLRDPETCTRKNV
uniref:PDZ domain-containing protein GIPC1 n=1 Tax=Lonchura striata TaxID=40157 RepID=UPI000B4D4D1B